MCLTFGARAMQSLDYLNISLVCYLWENGFAMVLLLLWHKLQIFLL